MDFIPPHKYLQWNPNTLEEVRRDLNLHRAGEMKEAVRILHDWVQQQAHFMKKDLPLHFLEGSILMAKGSIEKAKKIIDGICTVRTLMPEYFVSYNPKVDFKHLWEEGYWAVTPKLTPDNRRIFMFKIVGKYDSTQGSENVFKHALALINYMYLHDYTSGVVIIYDLSETDLMQTLKNYKLIELRNLYLIILESYKIRLQKFHIITTSKLINTFIAFFKPVMKAKIMERVIVNKSPGELSTYYPKDILPKDYGGDEKPLSELHEQCLDMLSTEEYLELAKSMLEARVDESLRPQGQFNETYAGTVGTFRSLNVD